VEKYDLKFMKEAIKWADACRPANPGIPKVGAIIAVDDEPIGRGRRGTGQACVTDRLWEVSDLVALLEADERGLERAAVNAK
jgi:hypothetical protein